MSGVAGGRVALVTGAGRRVGRAIAEELAAHGWRVAVHFHASASGAADTVAAIRATGGMAEAFGADLRDPSACEGLVPRVVAWAGRLDALVTSAAGMVRTPIGATAAATFDEIVALNLRAPFLLAQAAAAVLPDGGSIVQIADHLSEEPTPGFEVHGVAKAGVVALTRHLAAALAPRVRVNAVSPGVVLLPDGASPALEGRLAREASLGRIGTPADVAGAVRYLLDAPFVTGEVLRVDGGRLRRRPSELA